MLFEVLSSMTSHIKLLTLLTLPLLNKMTFALFVQNLIYEHVTHLFTQLSNIHELPTCTSSGHR